MEASREQWIVSYPDDGNEVCYALEDSSFWYQHRNACIVRAARTFGFSRQFHDIGGGNGVTAQALQQAGYDVTLVEPYRAGVVNAGKRGIRKAVHSTLENYAPTEKGAIEAVGFFDVMEHIEDDSAFLNAINALLGDGAKIMFTVPAYPRLWSDNDVQLGHFRRYSLADMVPLLDASGFQILYKTYFFSMAWLPMWLFRVLPSLLGFRQSNTPAKKKNEHLANRPRFAALLRRLLSWEVRFIGGKQRIPFGTSCLVVAEKKRNL